MRNQPANDDLCADPDATNTGVLLGRAAAEYFERRAAGELPSVEDYATKYPQIAEHIRRTFPALELVGDSASRVDLDLGKSLSAGSTMELIDHSEPTDLAYCGALALSGDGMLLASGHGMIGHEGVVCLWSIEWDAIRLARAPSRYFDGLEEVAFTPDGQRVAGGDVANVTLHHLKRDESRTIPTGSIHSFDFSPDGKRMVTAGHGKIRIWSLDGADAAHVGMLEPGNVVTSVRFLNNKQLFYIIRGAGVRVYDAAPRRPNDRWRPMRTCLPGRALELTPAGVPFLPMRNQSSKFAWNFSPIVHRQPNVDHRESLFMVLCWLRARLLVVWVCGLFVFGAEAEEQQKVHQTYEVIRVFGGDGEEAGKFRSPFGIRVGADSHLYVTDDLGHQIHVFDKQGNFIRRMGRHGTGRGELAWPDSVSFGLEGLMYIADTGTHRIQVWTPQGQYVTEFGRHRVERPNRQLQNPRDVVIGPEGNVWIADWNGNCIQMFTPSGESVRRFGRKGRGLGQFDGPISIAFGKDARVYVSEQRNHRVQVFTTDGEPVRQWGGRGGAPGQMESPHGIAFGPDGLLYLADYGNHRIQAFKPDGTFVRQLGHFGAARGELSDPTALCFDDDGLLYLADKGNHRVQIWRLSVEQ